MNKLIRNLLVAAGLTAAAMSGAQAQSTQAETAGICAGNAYKLKQYGEQVGRQDIVKMATDKGTRLFQIYGNQPGFDRGASFSIKNNDSVENRARVFDGCTKQGF